ncbi:GGDEF domain-containing protein [Cucumibacter marinus]|uniref:GGDEF domain-containing protein n=1 Tax=Cucumibacter marinus TaxID=1121252 RepID=UPI00138AE124|nr:GGDEF domain-containing protein [Cucumibacter marinus]
MSDNEYRRVLAYANTAMGMLERANIPPYPQFYELWYTYASGINEQLNQRINSMMAEGKALSPEAVMDLYREFLNSSDLEARISSVTAQMSSNINSVTDAMRDAMTTAAHYSGSLEEAHGDLSETVDQETLRALAGRLLQETRQMQEANTRLEDQLENSRDDILKLQRELDDARRESMLDPLTKIANRKCFDDRLAHEISIAAEQGTPLSLLLMDIDYFKRFNDTYGHQTGDQVLRLVAMTIKSNIKGRDLAARYGGEEFAAILPMTECDGAASVAENVRLAIQAKELMKRSTNEKLGRITLSVGVAQWRPGEPVTKLIERADDRLYAAKHAGRNRVVSAANHTPKSVAHQVA